jgi:hypothetical protein
MEYAIHLFKLVRINSEIKYVANSIVHDAPAYAYPSVTDVTRWQRDVLDRLDRWAADVPHLDTRNTYMETLCELRYHSIKMLLLRPSPAIPTPTSEMLIVCHESARRTIRLYEQLYKQDLLVHDWFTLHGITFGTITMLYCIRVVRSLAQQTEPEELMGNVGVSLSILSATGEHWSGAKRSRDVLENLGMSVIRWIKAVKAEDSRGGRDMAASLSDHSVEDGHPIHQSITSNSSHDANLLEAFPMPSMLPADMQMPPSYWLDPYQQQYPFCDMTNVSIEADPKLDSLT